MEKIEFDSLFNKTVVFAGCELIEYEKGNVTVKTSVNETDANPYKTAHGGYLYTLCDNLAGLVAYSLGNYVVTLNSNISYLQRASVSDELILNGKIVHDGRSTKVVEVEVFCRDRLICKSTFTLFVIGKVESPD